METLRSPVVVASSSSCKSVSSRISASSLASLRNRSWQQQQQQQRVSFNLVVVRKRKGSLSIKCDAATTTSIEASEMDASYIRMCVELAKEATGNTSPNPIVGCVIVKDGRIVGRGFHPKAGQPHAEVAHNSPPCIPELHYAGIIPMLKMEALYGNSIISGSFLMLLSVHSVDTLGSIYFEEVGC